jgi:hypothetical protein
MSGILKTLQNKKSECEKPDPCGHAQVALDH